MRGACQGLSAAKAFLVPNRIVSEDQAGKYVLIVDKDNVVRDRRSRSASSGRRPARDRDRPRRRRSRRADRNGRAVPGGRWSPKQETIPPPPAGANITTTK